MGDFSTDGAGTPALAIGVTVMHLVLDFAGGAAAAMAFKALSAEDRAA